MQGVCQRPYQGAVTIVNIAQYVSRLVAENLDGKLTRPLTGLKLAAYYGCLLSRGQGIVEGEDPENPAAMEAAIRAAGAEPVVWNYATECCGGGFSMSMTGAVVDLCHAILSDARAAGAEAVVVGCPMCHSNLDMRQRAIKSAGLGDHNLPVVYLSEVVALAAGLAPKAVGLDRHFVDAMCVAGRSD
jgi:heterodisulfide reductase subunit B